MKNVCRTRRSVYLIVGGDVAAGGLGERVLYGALELAERLVTLDVQLTLHRLQLLLVTFVRRLQLLTRVAQQRLVLLDRLLFLVDSFLCALQMTTICSAALFNSTRLCIFYGQTLCRFSDCTLIYE